MPPDIRRAVEGSLKGWHRLRGSRSPWSCPTIEAAPPGELRSWGDVVFLHFIR
jgi:hypothetical protein